MPSVCLPPLSSAAVATLRLIADLDQCFRVGFANLEPSHQSTLHALERVAVDTPFHGPTTEAIAAFQRYEFADPHFVVLAGLRLALQGALFEQLQHQAHQSLGRSPFPIPLQPAAPATHPLLDSARQWLMELALTGFQRVESKTLMPFSNTLDKLQEDPALLRPAALLTGFFNELIVPRSPQQREQLPLRRWGDLWSHAMLARSLPEWEALPVSGTLEPLGITVHQHAHLVTVVGYGVLTTDHPQFVRFTLSSYKVDAIQGEELWLLFPQAAVLWEAIAQGKTLHLSHVPLLPTGDLMLFPAGASDEHQVTLGEPYPLWQRAAQYFAVGMGGMKQPGYSPRDRHPVQLAEPVFLTGYKVETEPEMNLTWPDGARLRVAVERLGMLSALTPEAIAKSSELFGLLRFDAGNWAIQPLVLKVGKKAIATGQTAGKLLSNPPKASTVHILQERASRLLRK